MGREHCVASGYAVCMWDVFKSNQVVFVDIMLCSSFGHLSRSITNMLMTLCLL